VSARLCPNVCFRCGMPIYVGRYAPSGSSLCFDCLEEEKERTECEALAQQADAEEIREEKQ